MLLPAELTAQISQACALIRFHLETTLEAIHLYGSAVQGGLKPHSDIDLLVTVSTCPSEPVRQALLTDLLDVSSPPGGGGSLRPLEVTVVARTEVVPWCHPARRELQFGEWLRQDLLARRFETPVFDPDLAILLTQARQHSVVLFGKPAEAIFDPVPKGDFIKALSDTLSLWNQETDWQGDERNVVLALARIWYSASTGGITTKDAAASWAMERLPEEHRAVLTHALAAYLGHEEDRLAGDKKQTSAFILYAKSAIGQILAK